MKAYFFFSVLFASVYCNYAEEKHNNSTIKAMIVREIMKKVSNITLNSLSKVSEAKRELILNKIEQKLTKTAEGLTDGKKYVTLIMEEFKSKAFDKEEKSKTENPEKEISEKMVKIKKANPKMEMKLNILRDSKKNEELNVDEPKTQRKIFDARTKQHIISDIANKIESMAKVYLRTSQTLGEKQKILEKIQKRIIDSSRRKHMQIHNQHDELKAYTDLISQGLKLSMDRLLTPKTRRMDETELIETKALNDPVVAQEVNMKQINQYKMFFSEIWNETSIDPRCQDIVEEICLRIESLHKLSCGDGKIISLTQLCDGVSDCWNEADESNCTYQAIEKIRRAMSLISEIEQSISGKCLQPIVEGDILLYHHRTLRDMLKSQLDYLQSNQQSELRITTDIATSKQDLEEDVDIMFFKSNIGDVTMTVTSLSYTLESNLCSPHEEINKVSNLTRKSMNSGVDEFVYDDDDIREKPKWTPKSCICKKQYCKSDDCDSRCKRICWQQYSLTHWECKSITGGTSISLDLICDGKLDCFDETDESSCVSDSSVAKHEANDLYNDLLDILSLKSLAVEYEHHRNKIVAQSSLVRQLQKLTTKYNVNIHNVKILREQYFKMLTHIYGDMLQSSDLIELDSTYDFLLELNKKMVNAMKRSHTGNENVIASKECLCKDSKCATAKCSRKCLKTCLIEPLLTKYSCNTKNASVHLKTICNGKKDCPNEEDEKNCKNEICRAHHLVILRHNLQKAGTSLRYTALGEVLDGWKAKAMSSLIIAEGSERPNHKIMEDIISNILRDLVTAYASIRIPRRVSTEVVLKEFQNMAVIVQETLKFCGK